MQVKLKFMVDPEYLAHYCYVPKRVRICILKPLSPLLRAYLGASGKKMAKAGFPFYFEEKLAERLVQAGVAKRLDK